LKENNKHDKNFRNYFKNPIPTYLEWDDSSGYSKTDWRSEDDLLKLKALSIRSMAWVVAENEKQIWIVGHIAPMGSEIKPVYHSAVGTV